MGGSGSDQVDGAIQIQTISNPQSIGGANA